MCIKCLKIGKKKKPNSSQSYCKNKTTCKQNQYYILRTLNRKKILPETSPSKTSTNTIIREFPGGQEVRTQMFLLQGIWVQPLVWELRSHKPHGTAKKKKKKRERERKKILSDFKTRKKNFNSQGKKNPIT